MFDQNLSFLHKKWKFGSNISKYRLKDSKCGKVKPNVWYSIIISGKISKVLGNRTPNKTESNQY